MRTERAYEVVNEDGRGFGDFLHEEDAQEHIAGLAKMSDEDWAAYGYGNRTLSLRPYEFIGNPDTF